MRLAEEEFFTTHSGDDVDSDDSDDDNGDYISGDIDELSEIIGNRGALRLVDEDEDDELEDS